VGDAGGSRVSGGGYERRRGGGGNHGRGSTGGYGNWEARDDAVESVESEARSGGEGNE